MKLLRVLPALALTVLLTGCMADPYEDGMEQLKAGNYKEAEVNFEQAVEKDKNIADSYRGLGIAYFEQKDYENARNAFSQALKEGTEKNGTLYNFLGSSELALQNYEEAVGYYELGLTLEGNSKKLTQEMEYNLIVAYEGVKDWDKAKELISDYTAKYPDDEEAAKEAKFFETR